MVRGITTLKTAVLRLATTTSTTTTTLVSELCLRRLRALFLPELADGNSLGV
ncbi:MAG: hypothetical protein KME64_37250 [Scytonematopsis contorta HA4267-MV1]|nr:hypothetical protein [Scytonematopsis contorta HA4267-MV1]